MDAPEDDRLIGQTVSHYAIVGLIGAGQMGRVYYARDERRRREVAIKVPVRHLGAPRRRGHQLGGEARALSRLHHPHVAAFHDVLHESGQDLLVMEFVPGATLQDVIDGGPLPFDEVIRLGAQLSAGLAAVHAGRVIHCDVKPSNLKITTRGDLKILDFGLARLLRPASAMDSTLESTAELCPAGTMPYIAPELLRGETADERSDIFSAGAVLYEMATGRPAFPQRTLAHLIDAIQHQQPVAPSTLNPLVPAPLDAVVSRAMEKRPPERYQAAIDLADALESLSTPRARAVPPALTRWVMGLLA